MRKASATEAGLHMEPNPLQKNMDFSAQDKETTAKEYAYECLPTNVSRVDSCPRARPRARSNTLDAAWSAQH